MNIHPYSPEHATEVAQVFYQSVHAIDSSIYTAEQKEAWAPTPPDYEHWVMRLDKKKPFLAIIDHCVAGFMELDHDGHIDCAYTHPDFQGCGVASTLYVHLLAAARTQGIQRLQVEASYIAKPFFERRGFSLVKRNEMKRKGQVLVNFTMEKGL